MLASIRGSHRRRLVVLMLAAVALPPLSVSADIVAAVLPASRSVVTNEYASFFATVINAGTEDLQNCRASVANNPGGTFWYRPASPGNNFPLGERSTAADIAAGAAQPFYLEFRSTVALAPTALEFEFVCDDVAPAPVNPGVNTLLFSASTVRTPDVIALTATTTADGIVNIPTDGSPGFFTAATSNVGSVGNITVRAVASGSVVPVRLQVCETDPLTGVCTQFASSSKSLVMERRGVHTFAVFMTGRDAIPFDPANNRVTLQFTDNSGEIRGATSVAVRSANLTVSGSPVTRLLAGDRYSFRPTVGLRGGFSAQYSISNKPDWLTLSANGTLSGEPSNVDAGLWPNIVLTVSDGVGEVSLPPFSIEVQASAWRNGPSLPYVTSQHVMATVDDRLFYFGGGANSSTSGVREFDLQQNNWVTRAQLPSGLQLGGAHGVNGMVYVFGGAANTTATSMVQVYDPTADSWSEPVTMPFNRYGFASAELDGFVYLFGGLNAASRSTTNELRIYSTTTGVWSEGPSVPVRCDGMAASVIDRVIYLTGGCNNLNNKLVHAFDADAGSWSQLASLPVSIGFHQSAVIAGALYVFGGYQQDSATAGTIQKKVYRLQPEVGVWAEVQPMRTPRSAFGAAVLQNEIWVTGGIRTDSVEVFTPDVDQN